MEKPEPVLMIWDIYDGPRSGLAQFLGVPHYFDCELDRDAGGYTDVYQLWPIDDWLLLIATEQWELYRAWERQFHSGKVTVDTHPGHRGQNARYDELQDQIDQYLQELEKPSHRVRADFRAREEQPELPAGCLLELEVSWSPV